MNFALSWFPSSYSSELPLVFQHSLPWHQYTLANDIRVSRSFRKIRLNHAPLRSRQQPPWRHCRFQIPSVAVHISFSEANSNPRVLGQENKEEAEATLRWWRLSFDLGLCHAPAAHLTSACDAVWPWLLCVDFLFVTQKCYKFSHAQSNLSWSCLGCPTTQRPWPSLVMLFALTSQVGFSHTLLWGLISRL